MVSGFQAGRPRGDSVEVTPLQYADDTLIMSDANEDQLKILRVILVLFEVLLFTHKLEKKVIYIL